MRWLLLVLAFARTHQNGAQRAPAAGDALAPFQIQTLAGNPFQWRPGKVTLVTFCAYWCDTWKEHLKRLEKTNQMVNGLQVQTLAISVDGRWAELGANSSLPLTKLKDNGGAWSHSIGIDSVPFTMVVDASGNIRWTQRGVGRSDEMAAQIRSALESKTGGTIYLTFDDFPKSYSFELLDLLRAQKVPATFFCVCDRAAENAALLTQAVNDGNALEVHAWNHGEKNPPLAQCANALRQATGAEPTLYRAPGTETVKRLNGEPVPGRVVDPYDYKRPGKREIMRRVLSLLCPGCIIQLHAGVIETMDALPDIIAAARKQGYEFALLK